ncbi:unnamed protein product, partial [marine sediment metagenome]
FNSYGNLVQTIDLTANFDYLSNVNFTEVEIIDNTFTVAIPDLPAGDEICSIELLKVNGSSYQFSYFIDVVSENILFTLLTQQDLDGVYDSFSPISMDYGVSNKTHNSDQFIASFDFSQLTQDNYTFIGEFFDISGEISRFIFNTSISIDFHGPDMVGSAGNIGAYSIENVYLDAQFPEIELIEEQIFTDSGNIYNNTITDTIYFSDEKYIEISAFDELFDGFDWSQIDPIIADQLGLKNSGNNGYRK